MKGIKNSNSGLVYSTAQGRLCSECGKPVAHCSCRKQQSVPAGDGIVRVGRTTKGRRGKFVSLITGVPLHADDLQHLARQLKQKCGTGGTVKNSVIEIQGDHRDTLAEELTKRGFTVKRSGG
jgi:translation initiation factor 1